MSFVVLSRFYILFYYSSIFIVTLSFSFSSIWLVFLPFHFRPFHTFQRLTSLSSTPFIFYYFNSIFSNSIKVSVRLYEFLLSFHYLLSHFYSLITLLLLDFNITPSSVPSPDAYILIFVASWSLPSDFPLPSNFYYHPVPPFEFCNFPFLSSIPPIIPRLPLHFQRHFVTFHSVPSISPISL